MRSDVCIVRTFQVMSLLLKSNNDWWSVLRSNGQAGFIPAKYVREVEPKIVRTVTKVPKKQMVKVNAQKGTALDNALPLFQFRRTPSCEYFLTLGDFSISFVLNSISHWLSNMGHGGSVVG